jgi:hypothetical protein
MESLLTPEQQKELIRLGAEWLENPVKFAKDVFDFEPTPQQAPIMMALAKPGAHVAIKSGVSTGKTAIAAIMSIWFLLLHSPCKCVATSASSGQLQDALMPEIALWMTKAKYGIGKVIEATQMRVFVRGARETRFMTAKTARPDKPDALQGLHSDNILVIIDEAFGVDDKVIEVTHGALTKDNARLLMMGNPTATSGYAFRAFNQDAALYDKFTLSTLNSPLVSHDALEKLKQTYDYPDSPMARARLLGEFPEGGINQLITTDLVMKSIERYRTLQPASYQEMPVVLGVDTAWMGGDRSVVYLRQGQYSKILYNKIKTSVSELMTVVQALWQEYDAQSVFIDEGGQTGAALWESLVALGRNPVRVNFGAAASNPLYRNKTSEMSFELKKWLENGGCVENNEDLIADLTGPQYGYETGTMKMYVETKDQMRKRHMRSPDLFDALKLTFAYPVYSLSTTNDLCPGGSPLEKHVAYINLLKHRNEHNGRNDSNPLDFSYLDKSDNTFL